MSETKFFEVRDNGTFIPCIAIQVSGADGPLARRAGYGDPCVLFGKLSGGQMEYDPYSWGRSRTMPAAHAYIIEHWDALKSGDVVDARVALGEAAEPCASECGP